MNKVKIIECPRDAMQGIEAFISTEKKVEYLNQLLRVGFDTLDFGSFVSPKAIPQMKDTWKVIKRLDLEETDTKLLAIVANLRGATEALEHLDIDYLGFPFSVSAEFQKRNTNKDQETGLETINEIKELCAVSGKQLVVYLSMAFGNPYGEQWHPEIASHWMDRIVSAGIEIVNLSDTTGVANATMIEKMYTDFAEDYHKTEIGLHLHTRPEEWEDKVAAAYNAGCRRFDGAIKGHGGCPMAKDELVGNLATENLIRFLTKQNEVLDIDEDALVESMQISTSVFV